MEHEAMEDVEEEVGNDEDGNGGYHGVEEGHLRDEKNKYNKLFDLGLKKSSSRPCPRQDSPLPMRI